MYKTIALTKQNQIRANWGGGGGGNHTSQTSEDSFISSLGSSFSFASYSTGLNDGFITPDITGTHQSPK